MRHKIEVRSVPLVLVAGLVYALLAVGCASLRTPSPIASMSGTGTTGYLSAEAVPNGLEVLPPPPEPGSAAKAYDEALSLDAMALRNTPRWELATGDADLRGPQVVDTFSCALDASVSEADAPHLYLLMRKVGFDASLSTSAAKEHYRRVRPFVENGEPTCTPGDEEALKGNGS